jgi:transcriptional regulator with XRE-family HTH domain
MRQEKSFDRHKCGLTIGRMVREAREAAGLSQAELARRLERNEAYVSRLEQGKFGRPQPEVIVALAENLPIKLSDLCAVTNYPFPSELPSLHAYLRVMHPDWPDNAVDNLADYYEFIRQRYSLN